MQALFSGAAPRGLHGLRAPRTGVAFPRFARRGFGAAPARVLYWWTPGVSALARIMRPPQSFQGLSHPSKELFRFVQKKVIAHNGHPILRWNFDNVMMKTDEQDNLKPDKRKSSERIDGAVATIMALECAIKHRPSRGSLFVLDLNDNTWERYG